MEKKEDIIINLDELDSTKQYEKENLIYREKLDFLLKQIGKKVGENIKKENKEILRNHPCFFINGGRGSGKTTLLQALQRTLCETSSDRPKILSLAELDPTRLAEGENFFLHMLGHIHKLLDKHIKAHSILTSDEKSHYTGVYERISKLTAGLSVLLRRPEYLQNVADAGYYVQESVEGGVTSTSLQVEFAALLEDLCPLLKVDAMLVTVDDADMNFNKCSEVFETVRKHLLNRRIVFVFAGDLELYTMLIRGMQMHHFGKLSLKYDKTRESQRNQLMDNLEEQYILKLFPLNNRVTLLSFGAVLEKNPLLREFKNLDEPKNIKNYLKSKLGIDASEMALKQIERFMSILPMRSALQLLAYCRKNSDDAQNSVSGFETWRDGVQRVAVHALFKHGVDAGLIKDSGTRRLFQEIRKHVIRIGAGMEGAALRPGIGSNSAQLISFYLSTEFVGKVRKLEDVFSYVLEVFPRLQIETGQNEEISKTLWPEVRRIRHLGALCATEMLPLWNRDAKNIKMFANGSIPLFLDDVRESDMHVKRIAVDAVVRSMVRSMGIEPNEDKFLYFVAVRHSLNRVMESKQNFYCMSVYNLLAFIVRLLQLHSNDPDAQKEEIRTLLYSMDKMEFTAREINYKEAMADTEKTVDLSTYFKEGLDATDKEYKDNIIDRIQQWRIKYANKKIRVSAEELSNCWRDYFNECYLATKSEVIRGLAPGKFVQAGELFSRYLKIFETKFSIDVGAEESLLLSDCLVACPLWEIMRENTSQIEEMRRYCNSINIGPLELSGNIRRMLISCRMKLRNKQHRMQEHAKSDFHGVLRLLMDNMSAKWKERERNAMEIYMKELPDLLSKKNKSEYTDEEKQREVQTVSNLLMRRLYQREQTYKQELWECFDAHIEASRDNYYQYLEGEVKHADARIKAESGRVNSESDLLAYIEITANHLERYALRELNEVSSMLETVCQESMSEWVRQIDEFVRAQLLKPLPKTASSKKKNTAKKK